MQLFGMLTFVILIGVIQTVYGPHIVLLLLSFDNQIDYDDMRFPELSRRFR